MVLCKDNSRSNLFPSQIMCHHEPEKTKRPNYHLPNECYLWPDGTVTEQCSTKMLVVVWNSMGRVRFKVAVDASLLIRAELGSYLLF